MDHILSECSCRLDFFLSSSMFVNKTIAMYIGKRRLDDLRKYYIVYMFEHVKLTNHIDIDFIWFCIIMISNSLSLLNYRSCWSNQMAMLQLWTKLVFIFLFGSAYVRSDEHRCLTSINSKYYKFLRRIL